MCPMQPAQPGHSQTPCPQAGDKDGTLRNSTVAAGQHVPEWVPSSTGPRAGTKSSLSTGTGHGEAPTCRNLLPSLVGHPTILPCILGASNVDTGSGPNPGWLALGPSQPKAAVTRGAERSCLHSCVRHGGASQPRDGDVWKSTG